MRRLDALVLLALGLAVRVPLVLAWPGVHGEDSVARLAHSDTLLLGYQLPLPQLLVVLARALDPDPLWARLAFVLVGALVPVALALAVGLTATPLAGRVAGALLAVHPLFVYYSLVPYQEGLMLLFLLLGAAALLRGSDRLAAVAIGLACLCRYEAWIAAAMAAWAHRRRPLRALVLFGSVPILWVTAWKGLSPPGTYVLDLDLAADHLARMVFLAAKLREYSGDVLLLLAAAGGFVAWRRRDQNWNWGMGWLGLLLLAVVAAGHEFPPGSGRVSERLAHAPAAALCALAGLALSALAEGGPPRKRALRHGIVAAVVATLAVAWTDRAAALVADANRDPALRLAVQVAALAQSRLPPGGRLAVGAPVVGAEAVRDYVRRVERSGGDAERARAIAAELARRAPDSERIAAQLPRPPGAVIAAGAGSADLIAVYDDAPDRSRWTAGTVVGRFTAGERGVTVCQLGAPIGRAPSP